MLPTVVRRRKPDAAVQAELARLEATGLARSDAAALVVVEDHGVPARFKQDALNYEARRRVQARTRGVGDGARSGESRPPSGARCWPPGCTRTRSPPTSAICRDGPTPIRWPCSTCRPDRPAAPPPRSC